MDRILRRAGSATRPKRPSNDADDALNEGRKIAKEDLRKRSDERKSGKEDAKHQTSGLTTGWGDYRSSMVSSIVSEDWNIRSGSRSVSAEWAAEKCSQVEEVRLSSDADEVRYVALDADIPMVSTRSDSFKREKFCPEVPTRSETFKREKAVDRSSDGVLFTPTGKNADSDYEARAIGKVNESLESQHAKVLDKLCTQHDTVMMVLEEIRGCATRLESSMWQLAGIPTPLKGKEFSEPLPIEPNKPLGLQTQAPVGHQHAEIVRVACRSATDSDLDLPDGFKHQNIREFGARELSTDKVLTQPEPLTTTHDAPCLHSSTSLDEEDDAEDAEQPCIGHIQSVSSTLFSIPTAMQQQVSDARVVIPQQRSESRRQSLLIPVVPRDATQTRRFSTPGGGLGNAAANSRRQSTASNASNRSATRASTLKSSAVATTLRQSLNGLVPDLPGNTAQELNGFRLPKDRVSLDSDDDLQSVASFRSARSATSIRSGTSIRSTLQKPRQSCRDVRASGFGEDRVQMHTIWHEYVDVGNIQRRYDLFSTAEALSPMRFISHGRRRSSLGSKESSITEHEASTTSRWCKCFGLYYFKASGLDPYSPFVIRWSLFGFLCVAYDMIFIPLQLFELPRTATLIVIQWILALYWFIDIFLNFHVGFYRKGLVELKLVQTSKHYVKSYFMFDVLLVSLDFVMIGHTIGDVDDDASYARFLPAFRALRLVRVLRLTRLLQTVEGFIQSEATRVLIGILRLMCFIISVNHMVACLWYGLAKNDGTANNWLQRDFPDSSKVYFYTLCLHWSLTQFTPAAMELVPCNVKERAFNIVVILFALVTFSSFVSSITNAMTQLRHLSEERDKQFTLLHSYFTHYHISNSLCQRVRRHLEHVIKIQSESISAKDVPMLEFLSGHLTMELRYESLWPGLRHDGFFLKFDALHHGTMQRIACTAMDTLHVSPGDVLYQRGDASKKVYLMKDGLVDYQPTEKDVNREKPDGIIVKAGESLCEIALWAQWSNMGTTKALGHCHIISVDVLQFHIAVQESLEASFGLSNFAALYVHHMDNKKLVDRSDLRDPTFHVAKAFEVSYQDMDEDIIDEGEEEDEDEDDASDIGVLSVQSGVSSNVRSVSINYAGTVRTSL